MDYFIKFNLLEGIFWIVLGLVVFSLFLSGRFRQRYRSLLLFSSIVLVFFGASDFVEIKIGSFLEPEALWLLWWKIAGVAGLIVAFVWYFKIRSG
jgi:hypothetical protein